MGRGREREREKAKGEKRGGGEERGGGKMGGAEWEEMGSTLSINCKVYAVKRTAIFGTYACFLLH